MGELAGRSDTSVVTEGFYEQISSILSTARDKAYTAVNFAMVEAYWEIGKSIVEQQGGEERATYGDALLKEFASRLTEDFGKGFDARELRKMRQFHLAFPIRDALRPELSWTHYRRLIRIPNSDSRMWYMNECADSRWSTRQLERQINRRHFYIDLVFYNYLMRCFVLIDLKTEDLTHQDLGQMQMYVNYYTRELMNEGDNPPIGIVLCADKSDSIVEYTLPEDNDQVFAAKYLPFLPTKEELARELSAEYRAINESAENEGRE